MSICVRACRRKCKWMGGGRDDGELRIYADVAWTLDAGTGFM